MAFDAGLLYRVLAETKTAIDCHIDKIYQPSREELVLLLRKKGFAKRLYINIKSGSSRLHFTEIRPENPAVPPNFCMVLRKYISSARLTKITQPDLERVAEFNFSAINEMGDNENYRLVCELIGNSANVILLRENGKIIDALKHSDVENAKRLILPGAQYEYPEREKKLSPITSTCEQLCLGLDENTPDLAKHLLQRIDGFSPLVCREIETNASKIGLKNALENVLFALKNETGGFILYKNDATPFDYSYTEILQYGNGVMLQKTESFGELLDKFYAERENTARINAAAHDIIRIVKNAYARTEKRLGLRLNELKKCENRETFRIYGELIKANLYKINAGDNVAKVENYYDESLAIVEIPLNPALSPAKNAEKYFKEYKKTYTAANALTVLTENDRDELLYLESVLHSISKCNSVAELREIREELMLGGYVKAGSQRRSERNEKPQITEYTSVEGYRVLVGKNNLQNDYLTTRLAAKNDLWFHTKNIAGSHVIVMCGGGEVSDETLVFAAKLAAKNSKAATSAQVAVDYTPVKFVKKPNGAKPGMVIYTTNKTVYVNPVDGEEKI